MRKEILNLLKKQWLVIWIMMVSVTLLSMTASAIYESKVSTMNRVVVASYIQGMMFSSNYLEDGGDNAYTAKYCIELSEEDKSINTYDAEVYIWNYNPANISRWYAETIDYTLSLKLTNTKGEALEAEDMEGKNVKLCDSAGRVLTTLSAAKLSDTINNLQLAYDPAKASEDKYTLKFSGNWNLDDDTEICVQMIASLDRSINENKYKDLKDIGQIIGLKRSTNSESKGWIAYLKEQRSGETLSKCDGFNLVLNGSGQATITVTWDTTYLDFNRNFYLKDSNLYNFSEVSYTSATEENSWATMVIGANTASEATNHRNRYDIQLYKTGIASPENWGFFTDQNASQAQQESAWVKVSVNMA